MASQLVAGYARAQVPSPEALQAIAAKRDQTYLPEAFYGAGPVEDARRRTFDGAYPYFEGNSGRGAIYWHPKVGAHLIYGPFLDSFDRAGGVERLSRAPYQSDICSHRSPLLKIIFGFRGQIDVAPSRLRDDTLLRPCMLAAREGAVCLHEAKGFQCRLSSGDALPDC